MNEIKQNSPYAWFLAARPKTLTGAIIPVLLGSALAFSDGQFKTAPALLCALFACGMQIAANFINDLFDFQKGTDRREDRLGPQRACAEGWITPAAMKTGIGIALTLSCLAGLAVLFTVWGSCPTEAGTGGAGRGVDTVCFPLYHAALLSGLGRRTGAGVLRLRARMRHLLRAGLYAEYGCGGAVARQWPRHRHLADGEQLSRPRAGCRERQVYAGGTLRQEVR